MQTDEYRKLAEVEDQMWYFRALHAHVERELLAAQRIRSAAEPLRVLDAGCGTGGLIRRLAGQHPNWTWQAVDASPLACEQTRVRVGAAIDVREASVTELPFDDATFDAVVSADVIYHVADDAKALKEFWRVLRPGGVAVINVPAYMWLWSYHDVAVHSQRRYSRGEMESKLRAAGFSAVSTTFWNTLPFPLVVLRRKLLPAPRAGSDVHLFPAPLEAVFNVAMAGERMWLRCVGRLPFGSSILAVARKLPATSPVRKGRES